jgi:hypothetical protein
LTNQLEIIGSNCLNGVVSEVNAGHTYRLIGDNVNFQVGKKFKRSTESEKQMFHWFGSLAITQGSKFEHLPNDPQGNARDLTNDAFLPTENDKELLKKCYTNHLAKLAIDFFPAFKRLKHSIKNIITPECPDVVKYQNKTLVLPVLPLNEQSYSDVVQILDSYEETVDQIRDLSGVEIKSVQIGGDQLTRERFSGAKGLRAGCLRYKDRFDDLHPITFEMFHTAMNFLTLMYKVLMNEDNLEKGTLNSAKVRLKRSCVHMDVKNHYDDDKDFMVSFVRGYLLKAMLDYFGMEDVNDTPSKNFRIDGENVHANFEDFLDKYIFCNNSGSNNAGIPLVMQQVTLPNGMTFFIPLFNNVDEQPSTDGKYDYGVVVMELGLLFIEFIDVCKTPDRQRLLTVLKYMMMAFKINNNHKYALEILRFLCFQQSSYSLRVAYQAVHGLFVNNKGHMDSSIPADLHMEHNVKKIKSMLNELGSNKSKDVIVKRSKSLAGMDLIAHNYDEKTSVIKRAQHHKYKSATEDELKILSDLSDIDIFNKRPGQKYEHFENFRAPFLSRLDKQKFVSWIELHKNKLDFDTGK